ncbi:MAG: aspartate aminotransferase family protein [Coriobacteriia bacterium]
MASTDEPMTLEEAIGLDRPASALEYKKHVNPGLCTLLGMVGFDRRFVEAHGVVVKDDRGLEYLDFLGGYGALNLGHNHPEVIEAVHRVEGMPNLIQASTGTLVGALGQALAAIAPGALDKSFFCNSGAEAVEGALKLARIGTGRTDFLYATDSFHGKSFGALSVTGRSKYQAPFRPLVPGCHEVPYGDVETLEAELDARPCAAFIVEPIQGEGGIIVPPDGYLKRAEKACHDRGTLLIVDEIQTGLGRTGTMFAVEREGCEPDIMTTAKSLGGGIMPIGAFTASDAIWSAGYGGMERCALHTSTFGGNTRAMAAGLKTIEVLRRDGLADRARAAGDRLKSGLERIAASTGLIKEVRGRGLMLGVEFYEPKIAKGLSHEYLAASISALLLHDHQIITAYTLNNPNVIRFEPPLIVTDDQIDRTLGAFGEVCEHHHGLIGALGGLGRTILTHANR